MVIFIHIKIFIIKIVLTILVGVLIVENTKPFLTVYVARRFARLYSSLPLTFLENDLSLIPPIRGIVSLSSRGLRGSVVRLSILPCGFVAGAVRRGSFTLFPSCTDGIYFRTSKKSMTNR